MEEVAVIGGGLAGTEAAWQLATRGVKVRLYEMKPARYSAVHVNEDLAELVCSNSLGSDLPPHASFLLKEEMRAMGSIIIESAYLTRVPAGKALAVDRNLFSNMVTRKLLATGKVELVREEAGEIPREGIVCVSSGPLTSERLSQSLSGLLGEEYLYFFDAVSPIIEGASIDMSKAFFAARYEENKDDYLNIPLTRQEYCSFVDDLEGIEETPLSRADKGVFFEGCLPIEVMAKRGRDTLAFGPLKPVGFLGRKPGDDFYAVIQLRREDKTGAMFNMVGFQTRMSISQQKSVLRKLPGLKGAKFLRYGKMHRNTYVNSRKVLNGNLSVRGHENVYVAGQLTGVEGYLESAATGLLASLYIYSRLKGFKLEPIPNSTMMGSLIYYITNSCNNNRKFEPMNANFGVLMEHFDVGNVKRHDKKAYLFNNSLMNAKLWYERYCKKG